MQKNIYELTLITADKSGEKEVKEIIEALLTKVGGRLVDFVFQGKKDLVYPIKKHATVNFTFCELELEPAKLLDLNNRLRMHDDIWRHLLVRVNELKAKPFKAKPVKKDAVKEEIKKETKKEVVKKEKPVEKKVKKIINKEK